MINIYFASLTNFLSKDALECKRAVKWLCDFIVTQCSRPPPAHSKDLHSSIVAAFQTLVIWLVHHPYLLADRECLATVVEVAELGISGSKSQPRASDSPVMKEEKELSPASRRVRDAAEHLLSTVLEQVGYFPAASGAETVSSMLDEATLVAQSNSWSGETVDSGEAVQAFRYFVIDQTVILGILEPQGNDECPPQPVVTVLVRCPTSKAAWTLQLRHLPRHRSGRTPHSAANPGRPMAMEERGGRADCRPAFFPDSIERIPLCAADRSIPAVESVAGDDRAAVELDRLARLVESQAEQERETEGQQRDKHCYSPEFECAPPAPCTEFQTARLILSHLGFLSIPALRPATDSPVPRLVALENDGTGFAAELQQLDRMSGRTHDTVVAYYVRAGDTRPEQILGNAGGAGAGSGPWQELLAALGWRVDVNSHPGWTGDPATAWRVTTPAPDSLAGDRTAIYWADVTAELAVVVPACLETPHSPRPSSAQGAAFLQSDSDNINATLERAPTSLSLEMEQEQQTRRKLGRGAGGGGGAEQRVVLVWLESIEDADTFPLGPLCPGVNNVCLVIFVHPLASGLLRIKLAGQIGK